MHDNRPIARLLTKNPLSDRVPNAGFACFLLFLRSEKFQFAFFDMYVEVDVFVYFAVDFDGNWGIE